MQRVFKAAKHTIDGVLDYIHADVWGPIDVMSKGGAYYFLTFVDDFSKKVWVHYLAHKSEVFSRFKTWRAKVENQTVEDYVAFTLFAGDGEPTSFKEAISCPEKEKWLKA